MTCAEAEAIFSEYHADPAVGKDQRTIQAFSHAESCRTCWRNFDEIYCCTTRSYVQNVNQSLEGIDAPITPEMLGMLLLPGEIHFLVKHALICCYCELLLVVRRSGAPPPDDRTDHE